MASDELRVLDINMTEQRYGRYDDVHGTPDPMVRRLITIKLAKGMATFEQTDYGHPGRFNAWEPRGIDAALQPRTEALRFLCEQLGALGA